MTKPGPDRNADRDRAASGDGKAGEAGRKGKRKHTEELLDEALEESFPASDPPSIPAPSKPKDRI